MKENDIQQNVQQNLSFYGMGLAPKILESLAKLKFTIPMPIQHKAIPIALEGKDVVGVAQTGTGKTLAFALPMIQRLAAMNNCRGLVLVPTRELALQVNEVYQEFFFVFHTKTTVLIGGDSMYRQISQLNNNPQVIIATPGRLIDHIQKKNVSLSNVKILVLDEADRMLDMGFTYQIEQILKTIPRERQTMLFSATIPEEIMKITSRYMQLPVNIEIARSGTTADNIMQELYVVKKEDKITLLEKILKQYKGSVLLFSRTKRNATKITRKLRAMGHNAAEIHSDLNLNQRKTSLEGFKSGKYRILAATDIAARGIDVFGIEVVINFDIPDDKENYVHRIGRTGRAGQKGIAISFATPDQATEVRNIEKLIRSNIRVTNHPEMPAEKFTEYTGTQFARKRFIPRSRLHKARKFTPSRRSF